MIRIVLYCARFQGEVLSPAPLGLGYIASYLLKSHLMENLTVDIVDTLDLTPIASFVTRLAHIDAALTEDPGGLFHHAALRGYR